MKGTARKIFQDLEKGVSMPFYLLLGDEPFQVSQILERLKSYFLADDTTTFTIETFDGDSLDPHSLLESLETLPGLFSAPSSKKLVICSRFDKVSPSDLEVLQPYFETPCHSTVLCLLSAKADKRKIWYKHIEEKGEVILVNEPSLRDLPKWKAFFERKSGKLISEEAWHHLVAGSQGLMSLWSEVEKGATYVGGMSRIEVSDLEGLTCFTQQGDVFGFIEDVLCKRQLDAFKKFQALIQRGENEVKIFSLLIRQFRLVNQYAKLRKGGVTDPRSYASQLGVPPFVVSKLAVQLKHHSEISLRTTLEKIADCDYLIKMGQGNVFDHFLVSYFSGTLSATRRN